MQSLSHCEQISDDGIHRLGAGHNAEEYLEVLELDNCPSITDTALYHLRYVSSIYMCTAVKKINVLLCFCSHPSQSWMNIALFTIPRKLNTNSWAQLEGNHSREGEKTHVYFHKPFASNFSAWTTSILKILTQTNWQNRYNMDRFWGHLKHSQFVFYQI